MSDMPVISYNCSVLAVCTCCRVCNVATMTSTGNHCIVPWSPPFSANMAQLSTGMRSFSTPSLSIRPTESPADLSYTPTTLMARVMVLIRLWSSSISLYKSCANTKSALGTNSVVVQFATIGRGIGKKPSRPRGSSRISRTSSAPLENQ